MIPVKRILKILNFLCSHVKRCSLILGGGGRNVQEGLDTADKALQLGQVEILKIDMQVYVEDLFLD